MSRAEELVLRMWKALPDKERMTFEWHPVDEVRKLQARLSEWEYQAHYAGELADELREENERLKSNLLALDTAAMHKLKQAETVVEAAKNHICADYWRLPELTEAIRQYEEGKDAQTTSSPLLP